MRKRMRRKPVSGPTPIVACPNCNNDSFPTGEEHVCGTCAYPFRARPLSGRTRTQSLVLGTGVVVVVVAVVFATASGSYSNKFLQMSQLIGRSLHRAVGI
jgi:hypothetical protein